MKIRITYIVSIDDQELIDNEISLTDAEAIQDYFYENGGEDFDYCEDFEIIG